MALRLTPLAIDHQTLGHAGADLVRPGHVSAHSPSFSEVPPELVAATTKAAVPLPQQRTRCDISAQDARTERALKAIMTPKMLTSAVLKAQRQRELFFKLPHRSDEALEAAVEGRATGGELVLSMRPQMEHNHDPEGTPVACNGGAQLGHTPILRAWGGWDELRGSSSGSLHLGGAGWIRPLGKSSPAGPIVTGGSASDWNIPIDPGCTFLRSTYNDRPKVPPAEIERTWQGGDGGPPDDGLDVSKSAAQEKLRALAKKTTLHAKTAAGREPCKRLLEQKRLAVGAISKAGHIARYQGTTRRDQPPSASQTAPVPVDVSNHLPIVAPILTPRTVRSRMVRNDLSEPLRHNLLWMRRQDRADMAGPQPRHKKSAAHAPSPQRGMITLTLKNPNTLPPAEPRPRPPAYLLPPEEAPKKKPVRMRTLGQTASSSDYYL